MASRIGNRTAKIFILRTRTSFASYSELNKSKVYFIPKSRDGLGIDSMSEFATTLELSNQFIDEEGKPVPFIYIAKALESAFNFTFGNAYKSKNRIFSRKPYNLTKALDYLKNLLIRASKNKDKRKDEKR